ncbi:SUMF1/EgtB/PvdO family nonheme iron enzyme [Neptuniibacter pectenicola]|jgi:formylglycine-generating enzyme required for sulfatase activity|uniref:SUMF1/EgtB/PvdO family nonheme iron enzyme n=1 Tax=Neptuniibacter pectenicola TaxID=1806669 RepID=UPI0030EE5A51
MSDTADSIYQSLQEGTILGPEHHRFQLISNSSDHLLGQLWQAKDVDVAGNPLVTLIIINPALLKQSTFAEGIKKHAALSKQLQNKHIAECYGFFPHKGGLLLLSYEKLDGLTLSGVIQAEQPLQLTQRLGLLRQIAYAVDMSFQKLRSPHACLSPDVIYINRKGGVKLTLPALRDALESITDLLPAPPSYQQYQSPEAFHLGKLSRKTDVYAFAAIIYELFTGKPPFNVNDSEADRVRKQLEQPAELDNQQWEALQKAFSTDIEERFTSCTELMKAVFPPKKEDDDEKKDEAPQTKPSETEGEEASTDDSPPLSTKEKLNKTVKQSIRRLTSISQTTLYVLMGCLIFVAGYLSGWAVSELFNFKEKDFQALQITKQQEALQQMYDTLQAQQEIQTRAEQELSDALQTNALLEQELLTTKRLLKAEPDSPGQQIFKDQIDSTTYGPEMVLLPSGDFRMGDQSGIGDDNEKPVHLVKIRKPFALSRFEVTFAEYDTFANATNRPLPNDGGWGRDNQPVINVSWRDAVAYAEWLGHETGHPYRLPTEAEWEYAARAGTVTTYWWGDELKPNMASCTGCGSAFDGKQPAPVGSFPANNWGLHDMTGNVDEWVFDCYTDSYKFTPTNGSAYTEKACENRVMRGGSWFEIDRLIRPASRYRHPVDSKRNSWGFRVALDIK